MYLTIFVYKPDLLPCIKSESDDEFDCGLTPVSISFFSYLAVYSTPPRYGGRDNNPGSRYVYPRVIFLFSTSHIVNQQMNCLQVIPK